MMGIEPVTRKEMFMAAAAGESVTVPTPVTREEYFLSKIVGSGGGGAGLPSGGAPYQQLVTDGEGNAKWEDRLAYSETEETQLACFDCESVYWNWTNEFGGYYTSMPMSDTVFELPIAGEMYTVKYVYKPTGEERSYNALCKKSTSGVFTFGNFSSATPFQIIFEESGDDVLIADVTGDIWNERKAYYIYILHINTIISPIDEKYLPDTVATKSDVEAASGQLIVTVYATNMQQTIFAADKTYDEISAAIDSGMSVVLNYKSNINSSDYLVYYHALTEDGRYQFCSAEIYMGSVYLHFIDIYEENGEMVIYRNSATLQIVPK